MVACWVCPWVDEMVASMAEHWVVRRVTMTAVLMAGMMVASLAPRKAALMAVTMAA